MFFTRPYVDNPIESDLREIKTLLKELKGTSSSFHPEPSPTTTTSNSSSSMEHAACNRCQRTFGSASSLARHSITPSQCHRPYHVCVKCKKSYASSQSLSNHKRRCNGPESNLCHICKRAFSTHRALANHKRWKCNLNDQKERPATVAAVSDKKVKMQIQ